MLQKKRVSWDLTPCRLLNDYRRFRGSHCHQLQGRVQEDYSSSILKLSILWIFLYQNTQFITRTKCTVLTLNPLTWKIWRAPNNASNWQMGFNSAFKGLINTNINPLNAELNPICHLLGLLGAHHILHVSRIRVKGTSPTCFPTNVPSSCRIKCQFWEKPIATGKLLFLRFFGL